MQMITVSHGETMLTTPDAALALQVLTGLSASAKLATAPSGIPAIGEYWPGEGGVNGGLFPGGDKPYYLIVPIGADAEKDLKWGGYGDELDGASSPRDGLANTADLVGADNEHPAAQFCATFERDGKEDFYLMARREAQFLEITVPDVFSKRWHWTSTQSSANLAYTMGFGVGWLYNLAKSHERVVRPVRRKYF